MGKKRHLTDGKKISCIAPIKATSSYNKNPDILPGEELHLYQGVHSSSRMAMRRTSTRG